MALDHAKEILGSVWRGVSSRTMCPIRGWTRVVERQDRASSEKSFFLLYLFCVLGLQPENTDVPRLKVEWELKLSAYSTATAKHKIRATSAIYATAPSKAGSLIH